LKERYDRLNAICFWNTLAVSASPGGGGGGYDENAGRQGMKKKRKAIE
jgi:hypothetical protein